MRKLWMRWVPLVAAMGLVTLVSAAFAEDYVLGSEDVVQISVWLHPELDRVLTISADGNITLPPVGDIKAATLSPKQLGDRVADRLSAYLRQTTTVTVTVTQYMSRSVFVTGGVAKPGRYGFERIPTLVDVLGQAGGALPGSDLSGVQVLRKEGAARRTINADLSAALRTGDASGLPELKPGDTVVIPGAAAGVPVGNEGVAVLGEVNKPGLYAVTPGQDVWSALAMAGGITARGSLKDVRLLTRADGGQNVTTLDLDEVLHHGSRAPVAIKPGDVLVVITHGPGAFTVLANVLGLSRDALNAALLVDYFQNRNNNTTTK
jgi:polysaccharide export outer membrane protein